MHSNRDFLSLGGRWITTSLGLVAGPLRLFFISKSIYTMKRHRWKFLPHLADSCVLVSTGAMVGWWGDTLQYGASVFLGQSRGGWSPLNDSAAVQLPLCPLAAFYLSPKSEVMQSSPSETSWVTQACQLLSVAHGPGQRCYCGCLQWDGQGQQLWGQPLACPCPMGHSAGMLMVGDMGGRGRAPRREVSTVWGAGTVGFGAPHP